MDLSRAYLGNRGVIAVAALVRHMPDLEELDLSKSEWFNADESPSAPGGEQTLSIVCRLLMGHPGIRHSRWISCISTPTLPDWAIIKSLVRLSSRLQCITPMSRI